MNPHPRKHSARSSSHPHARCLIGRKGPEVGFTGQYSTVLVQYWYLVPTARPSRARDRMLPRRALLHGQQHRCCESDASEEQVDVNRRGAVRIAVLGDSLSSTEGRCQAYRPWPMLMQDSLGTGYVVHGFAMPGISAQGYRWNDNLLHRATSTDPDMLAISE